MHLRRFHVPFFVLTFCVSSFAGTHFKATTTLSAETANNTSAADTFVAQTNGNAGAGNVSKVPLHNLLYAGATARIYTHFMPWFGATDHMNVGYTSNDVLQVQRQVNDMVSRGLDGAIIDWYGRGTLNKNYVTYDHATQLVMQQAQLHAGFKFAITYDGGALRACAGAVGCDVTQMMIDDLNYVATTYEGSAAYLWYGGRPVIYFFGQEAYTIDWTRVRAGVANNPLFIFRNSGGFTLAQSGGAFSWVAPETVTATNPIALNYLDGYYKTALTNPLTYSTGSGYKGFNDTLAAWGSGRIISQQCGQTWLQTLAEAGKYYSGTSQMLGIQLVTWNDYEEGSEIESGIDNCVAVTPTVAGTVASWTITGQQNTIDHFSIFISQDGQNLMWLADATPNVRSMDLAQFSLDAGNYLLFVKATGAPSMTNKMSAGVQVTVPNLPPVASLSVTPASGTAPVTVTASTAASSDVDGTIASSSINFGDGSAPVAGPSASHIYSAAGTYAVTATVTDNLGASSSTSATVLVVAVNKPPVAQLALSATSGYGPMTVSASTSGSTDPDGTVVSSTIDFGDSTSAAGPNATHTYSAAGSYTVLASVTDNSGATSSTSATVTIKAPEVIVSSPTTSSVASPIHVVATGYSGLTVTAMQIYLAGTLVYQVNAASLDTTIAASSGTQSLTIKGWDSSGRNFSKSILVSVTNSNQPPLASLSLSATSLLAGASITASTAASSDPDGTIASSQINFGDGTVVTATSATHQFRIAGTFTVKATVTDNGGASSTTSKTVTVNPQFVTITSPSFTSTTSSSITVSGSGFSGYGVTTMQVYIDGSLRSQVSGTSISTTASLGKGTHTITLQGWDRSGAAFKKSMSVTRN
jgi:PKD repeat protein